MYFVRTLHNTKLVPWSIYAYNKSPFPSLQAPGAVGAALISVSGHQAKPQDRGYRARALHGIQYNTIQYGYLVPPIHETGPGGITIVIKCV